MKSRLFLRGLSVALAAVYLATNCAFAHKPETALWAERRAMLAAAHPIAPIAPLPPVQRLPMTAYGSVRKLTMPAGSGVGKTLIHIQDVHGNAEAQRNISQVVQALIESKQVDLIALEGAFEPIDLTPFHRFSQHRIVRGVADYLLRENRISGPIHAAFTTAAPLPPIVGIDDRTHYDANVDAYKKSALLIKDFQKRLDAMKRDLGTEKSKIFRPRLAAFDEQVRAYREGKLALGAYAALLAASAGRPSPEVSLFLEALSLESTLDFSRVETERSSLLSQLMPKLSRRQLDGLADASAAYRAGNLRHADFYAALKNLCRSHEVALARFPSMESYLRYVLLSDRVDSEKLFSAVNEMERGAYEALAATADEKKLVAKSKQFYLTGKLLDFSLTREEWKDYRDGEDLLALPTFNAFYEEAEARDQAMARNLLAAMEKTNAKSAVLVTGGFHANGIRALAQNAGLRTVSFVPKITHVDAAGGSAYLSVFTQEKAPLEKLFEGEKLFLARDPLPNQAQFDMIAGIGGVWEVSNGPQQPLAPSELEELRQLAGGRGVTTADVEAGIAKISFPIKNIHVSARVSAGPGEEIRGIKWTTGFSGFFPLFAQHRLEDTTWKDWLTASGFIFTFIVVLLLIAIREVWRTPVDEEKSPEKNTKPSRSRKKKRGGKQNGAKQTPPVLATPPEQPVATVDPAPAAPPLEPIHVAPPVEIVEIPSAPETPPALPPVIEKPVERPASPPAPEVLEIPHSGLLLVDGNIINALTMEPVPELGGDSGLYPTPDGRFVELDGTEAVTFGNSGLLKLREKIIDSRTGKTVFALGPLYQSGQDFFDLEGNRAEPIGDLKAVRTVSGEVIDVTTGETLTPIAGGKLFGFQENIYDLNGKKATRLGESGYVKTENGTVMDAVTGVEAVPFGVSGFYATERGYFNLTGEPGIPLGDSEWIQNKATLTVYSSLERGRVTSPLGNSGLYLSDNGHYYDVNGRADILPRESGLIRRADGAMFTLQGTPVSELGESGIYATQDQFFDREGKTVVVIGELLRKQDGLIYDRKGRPGELIGGSLFKVEAKYYDHAGQSAKRMGSSGLVACGENVFHADDGSSAQQLGGSGFYLHRDGRYFNKYGKRGVPLKLLPFIREQFGERRLLKIADGSVLPGDQLYTGSDHNLYDGAENPAELLSEYTGLIRVPKTNKVFTEDKKPAIEIGKTGFYTSPNGLFNINGDLGILNGNELINSKTNEMMEVEPTFKIIWRHDPLSINAEGLVRNKNGVEVEVSVELVPALLQAWKENTENPGVRAPLEKIIRALAKARPENVRSQFDQTPLGAEFLEAFPGLFPQKPAPVAPKKPSVEPRKLTKFERDVIEKLEEWATTRASAAFRELISNKSASVAEVLVRMQWDTSYNLQPHLFKLLNDTPGKLLIKAIQFQEHRKRAGGSSGALGLLALLLLIGGFIAVSIDWTSVFSPLGSLAPFFIAGALRVDLWRNALRTQQEREAGKSTEIALTKKISTLLKPRHPEVPALVAASFETIEFLIHIGAVPQRDEGKIAYLGGGADLIPVDAGLKVVNIDNRPRDLAEIFKKLKKVHDFRRKPAQIRKDLELFEVDVRDSRKLIEGVRQSGEHWTLFMKFWGSFFKWWGMHDGESSYSVDKGFKDSLVRFINGINPISIVVIEEQASIAQTEQILFSLGYVESLWWLTHSLAWNELRIKDRRAVLHEVQFEPHFNLALGGGRPHVYVRSEAINRIRESQFDTSAFWVWLFRVSPRTAVLLSWFTEAVTVIGVYGAVAWISNPDAGIAAALVVFVFILHSKRVVINNGKFVTEWIGTSPLLVLARFFKHFIFALVYFGPFFAVAYQYPSGIIDFTAPAVWASAAWAFVSHGIVTLVRVWTAKKTGFSKSEHAAPPSVLIEPPVREFLSGIGFLDPRVSQLIEDAVDVTPASLRDKNYTLLQISLSDGPTLLKSIAAQELGAKSDIQLLYDENTELVAIFPVKTAGGNSSEFPYYNLTPYNAPIPDPRDADFEAKWRAFIWKQKKQNEIINSFASHGFPSSRTSLEYCFVMVDRLTRKISINGHNAMGNKDVSIFPIFPSVYGPVTNATADKPYHRKVLELAYLTGLGSGPHRTTRMLGLCVGSGIDSVLAVKGWLLGQRLEANSPDVPVLELDIVDISPIAVANTLATLKAVFGNPSWLRVHVTVGDVKKLALTGRYHLIYADTPIHSPEPRSNGVYSTRFSRYHDYVAEDVVPALAEMAHSHLELGGRIVIWDAWKSTDKRIASARKEAFKTGFQGFEAIKAGASIDNFTFMVLSATRVESDRSENFPEGTFHGDTGLQLPVPAQFGLHTFGQALPPEKAPSSEEPKRDSLPDFGWERAFRAAKAAQKAG